MFYNLILYSLCCLLLARKRAKCFFVERLKGCGLPRGRLFCSVCVPLVPVLPLDESGGVGHICKVSAFRGWSEDSKCQSRQNIYPSNKAPETTGTIVQIYSFQRNSLVVAAVVRERPIAVEIWGKCFGDELLPLETVIQIHLRREHFVLTVNAN